MNHSDDLEIRNDWQVIRQDDNGNIFVVANQLSENDARKLVKAYEAKGHKQTFWAERPIPS